jgi:crotonobetaine/carnitine-CoA ligase
VVSSYGSTDYTVASLLPADRPTDKWRSSGQVRPELDVRIFDEHDVEVPIGTTGEICVRSNDPWICNQGYYGMPEETLRSRRNLWYHSGDLGHLDSDGYLYFDGRGSDRIRRRGENVSAHEIEQILATHEALTDVAAFAVPSDLGEDEVMVSVILVPGATLTEREIVEFASENMAHFMVPRYVAIVDELPRTATQKVEKRILQAAAAENLPSVWDREREGVSVSR